MSNPVEFRLALSNSHPSGTGSYVYEGSFQIVVQNLAFEKHVAIWAQVGSDWRETPARFVESLPENREQWQAIATNSEDQFVAQYTVCGVGSGKSGHPRSGKSGHLKKGARHGETTR